MTNQMAEHALWSIWLLRMTGRQPTLARGTQCLSDRKFDCLQAFGRAVEHSPDFAEAYNQRAIAYYLQERSTNP